MHKFSLRLLSSLVLLLGIAAVAIAAKPTAQQNFTVLELRFFEGDAEKKEDAYHYDTARFSQGATRYIYSKLHLVNHLHNKSDNPLAVTFKYYAADGKLLGEPTLNYTITKNWQKTAVWQPWGYKDPGKWNPGNYRVEAWTLGKKIAERSFEVYQN